MAIVKKWGISKEAEKLEILCAIDRNVKWYHAVIRHAEVPQNRKHDTSM